MRLDCSAACGKCRTRTTQLILKTHNIYASEMQLEVLILRWRGARPVTRVAQGAGPDAFL